MNARNVVVTAMMIALTAALGLVKIPMPFFNEVPITGQSFGVMLAGALLGARLGGLSMLVFIALVAVGAPLLSGGAGGLAVFASARGGWVLSFPLAAFLIGYLVERSWMSLKTWKVFSYNILGGIVLIYLVGMAYQAALTGVPFAAVAVKSMIFLPGDLLKSFVAAIIAVRLRHVYPLIRWSNQNKLDESVPQ